MYINPKYVILGMAVVILLLLIYIAYLIKVTVTAKQQVVVMNTNGKPMDNADVHRTIAPLNASPAQAIIPNGQTDFFRKSVEYAMDYVSGRVQFNVVTLPIPAQQVLVTTGLLNDAVKQNIITAIKYYSIDTTTALVTEQKMRLQSEQERIPLWVILVRDAVSKVVPYIDFSNNNFNPNYVAEAKPTLNIVKSA